MFIMQNNKNMICQKYAGKLGRFWLMCESGMMVVVFLFLNFWDDFQLVVHFHSAITFKWLLKQSQEDCIFQTYRKAFDFHETCHLKSITKVIKIITKRIFIFFRMRKLPLNVNWPMSTIWLSSFPRNDFTKWIIPDFNPIKSLMNQDMEKIKKISFSFNFQWTYKRMFEMG